MKWTRIVVIFRPTFVPLRDAFGIDPVLTLDLPTLASSTLPVPCAEPLSLDRSAGDRRGEWESMAR